MVIYGPNRKEYDVYGKDVTNLITADDSDHYDSGVIVIVKEIEFKQS
jgi:hypothetical protein